MVSTESRPTKKPKPMPSSDQKNTNSQEKILHTKTELRASAKVTMQHSPAETAEELSPTMYKILKGEPIERNNEVCGFAKFCLLVREPSAESIVEAFANLQNRTFDWSICEEDISEEQILHIPTELAHLSRSIGEIPKDFVFESDLLQWLIHGESYFNEKYVLVETIDCYPTRWFKIASKEHMSFLKLMEKNTKNDSRFRKYDVDRVLPRVKFLRPTVMDHVGFLRRNKFGNDVTIVDGEFMKKVESLDKRNFLNTLFPPIPMDGHYDFDDDELLYHLSEDDGHDVSDDYEFIYGSRRKKLRRNVVPSHSYGAAGFYFSEDDGIYIESDDDEGG